MSLTLSQVEQLHELSLTAEMAFAARIGDTQRATPEHHYAHANGARIGRQLLDHQPTGVYA